MVIVPLSWGCWGAREMDWRLVRRTWDVRIVRRWSVE
jgi:hypothetical protein